MDSLERYTNWFRGSTPYISAHRGKTFVVFLGGDALAHSNLANIVHDLALLNVLGVRLVIVHGGRPQLDAAFSDSHFHAGRRITSASQMLEINGIYGALRAKLEALFSTGLPNTPLHNVEITLVSGNFVAAQPIGIIDGVDHQCTGRLRSAHVDAVQKLLDSQAIVLQSPVGFSASGQAFNLAAEELAAELAAALGADKLIMFNDPGHLTNDDNQRISRVTPNLLNEIFAGLDPVTVARCQALVSANTQGVQRGHLIAFANDGALLQELFTADGIGTQVSTHNEDLIRQAQLEDVADIVEIIRPLEDDGVLVPRSRAQLEHEIGHFFIAELDGVVVGCCAVYVFADTAELACVAVHENYRHQYSDMGIGSALLETAEQAAAAQGANNIFVLTTQTQEWFVSHGFAPADVESLPSSKQSLYNWQRGAAVLQKHLNA
ncbi:MAG TPA: amino-acid N-acetyltransferase [Gammaproteobacteria bacterium]|nr:amino-acid N-acetyltransferase [Gammaproteobacteria bacterium]